MIYLERTITIANSSASIDEPIILYKGDRNVEIQFVLKNSPFRYKSSTNPTYGQLIINRENADSIFSDVSETVKGKILFVITGDMIDELNECGNYDFQIRLFNEDKTSRVTLMPIIAGITIREPICEDDEANKETPYIEAYFDLKTSNKTNYSQLFERYTGETLDVSNLDTSNVTNMSYMFRHCNNLTSLNVSNWDTSNVTNMSHMFSNCYKLIEIIGIENFNTSNVTSFCGGDFGLFSNCESLTQLDLSNWDTSNITDMCYMFRECTNLTQLDVSNFNTSNVTNMNRMFYKCESLTELDISNFDTSNVTSMGAMFYKCQSLIQLDISNWDTSNVTDMSSMFGDCQSLIQLDISNFNTINVTNMGWMFSGCDNLTSLDLSNWDTSNVTNTNGMCQYCTSLTELRLDNCSNNTISKIITSKSFPTNAIDGVTRTIYCKEENAAGLTPPTNWVFSCINN